MNVHREQCGVVVESREDSVFLSVSHHDILEMGHFLGVISKRVLKTRKKRIFCQKAEVFHSAPLGDPLLQKTRKHRLLKRPLQRAFVALSRFQREGEQDIEFHNLSISCVGTYDCLISANHTRDTVGETTKASSRRIHFEILRI